MGPTETHWIENGDGEVICVWHGDQVRRTRAIDPKDLKDMDPWRLAHMLTDAFKLGMDAKAHELRLALNLK